MSQKYLTLCHPFPLETPQTKPVRFEKYFKRKDVQCFVVASSERDRACAVLKAPQEPRIAAKVLQDYLPFAMALSKQAAQVIASAKKLDMKGNPDFVWTSALLRDHKKSFKFHLLTDDEAQIAFCIGVHHYIDACRTLNSVYGSAQTEEKGDLDRRQQGRNDCIQYLKLAAGVWKCMATDLLPMAQRDPQRFPDTFPDTANALSTLALVSAQELAIESGILKGTSPAVLAKLCSAVDERCRYIQSLLPLIGSSFEHVSKAFLRHLDIKRKFYEALARKYMSIACEADSNKAGEAVTWANTAYSCIESAPIPDPKEDSALFQHGWLKYAIDAVRYQRREIQQQLTKVTKENDNVFYQTIPDQKTLILPEPKFIAVPTPYTLPEPAAATFFEC